MRKEFTEALGDLLAQYSDLPVDEVIDIMELHLDGLRDDLKRAEANADEARRS